MVGLAYWPVWSLPIVLLALAVFCGACAKDGPAGPGKDAPALHRSAHLP